MKVQTLLTAASLVAASTLLSFHGGETPPPSKTPPPYTRTQIEKGKYLVGIMGCRDCHSPKTMTPKGPAPDLSRDLSGHPASMPLGKVNKEAMADWVLFNAMSTAAAGPWGVSFSANLTPDATGIGSWSEEQFVIALTEGKSKGMRTARPLLPPMPWQNYVDMKRDDIVAMFAYLKSIKPIENVVPQPITPDKL
ncbi:diheme cytochrome c-553 [Fibrella sp. WM1]|uniref:diheme cytochrome c-553 n=1 Tax=Fibrella musci TaxID=3242485 RepID=UPI0035218A92